MITISKTILVDVDDVIENLCPCWCHWLNENYGTNVSAEDIIGWDISKFFPELTHEQIFEPLLTEGFWKTVTPKLDAIKYLNLLYEEGYRIFLCTASDYRTIKHKYENIVQRYFPYIDWNHIIICSVKQLIKADILIDDGVHNLIGGDYMKILYTTPHNKSYNAEDNGIFRVNDWEELYNTVHFLT